MGLDMAKDGGLMKDMLGLGDSGPSGKLSSTERTAKQKAKLQRGLLREATQSAQAMAKTNAAARAQWAQSPVALTAPRACRTPPAYAHHCPARLCLCALGCHRTDQAAVTFVVLCVCSAAGASPGSL